MDTINAEVKKAGEQVVMTSISRHRAGVKVQVKSVPVIEDFFRDLSGGEIQPVSNHARHWFGIGTRPLQVYSLPKNPGTIYAEDGRPFVLDKPGHHLLIQDPSRSNDPGATILNLSFLRFQGISEGDGVGFTIKTVMDLSEMQRLANRIMLASRRFYIAYMMPVNITVFVSTQETR